MDQIACYQLILTSMPKNESWQRALQSRSDGSDPNVVLRLLMALRQELWIRIGDLGTGDQHPIPNLMPATALLERRVTYQLALDHLPADDLVETAILFRRDGSHPRGVLATLEAWRRELRVRLGDTVDQETYHS